MYYYVLKSKTAAFVGESRWQFANDW